MRLYQAHISKLMLHLHCSLDPSITKVELFCTMWFFTWIVFCLTLIFLPLLSFCLHFIYLSIDSSLIFVYFCCLLYYCILIILGNFCLLSSFSGFLMFYLSYFSFVVCNQCKSLLCCPQLKINIVPCACGPLVFPCQEKYG
jgi:hypothetical protein